ncbi:MAG: hypothetical protein MUF34_26845 [Polyangiaceae bacterium]|nr:hypothetical protein [Polyangiaceae bacterium]
MIDPNDPATRALLDELRVRQSAFLAERMTSPRARDEWRDNFGAIAASLLALPVEALVPPARLARALDEALSAEAARSALAPLTRAALPAVLRALRAEPEVIGAFVPDEARQALDGLLARPGLVPERLVREVLEHDAVEAVMRDVLAEVLREFSEKVNPFFADWGLPAILRRWSPLAAGAVNKALEGVREEFNRRLEPETRRFLQAVTRRSLRSAADAAVAMQDGPKFVALRRHLAAWLLEQRFAELLVGIDAAGEAMLSSAAGPVQERLARHEALQKRRREALDAFFRTWGSKSAAELLGALGVEFRPDVAVVADLLWPAVEAALKSEPGRAWITSLVDEFYASLAADQVDGKASASPSP